MRLPIHLAFYWLGVGRERDDRLFVRSEVGPYVEELSERFAHVTVLAYETPTSPSLAEDVADYAIQRDNVGLVSLGPKGTWRDYRDRRNRVAAIVKSASGEWDVLLLRFDRRADLVAATSLCPRTVAMVHGYSGAVGEPGLPLVERARLAPFAFRTRRQLRRIVRSAGLLVTDGEHYLDAYGRYAHDSVLIRHSLRREKWSYRAADRLDRPDARFLFVGRLSSRKGILETVESFARIRERLLPAARLDVVGEGPELASARELARRRGVADAVTFHGAVAPGETLFSLFRDSDVLLFLSRSESFPKVVSEAMAHSVLVVSTPVGALPLALQANRDVMFVSAPSPDQVVAAVAQLLQDPALRRAMIEHGERWARETSLEAVVKALAGAIVRRWPECAESKTQT
jgi:glycosyltransferase involved in cell wall biosynthesis